MSNAETRPSHVLILSDDPLAAALLGLLVEETHLTPAFAVAGEPAHAALLRVRPVAVVLLDGGLAAAHSDMFFAAAARSRVALAMFGTQGRTADTARHATVRGVPYFSVPTSLEGLTEVIEEARETRWWVRQPDRRHAASAGTPADSPSEGLVYMDADGRPWRVYDRRGSHRRQAADAPVVRMFVSDAGEVRSSVLAVAEAGERSAQHLAEQFARARLR